MKKKVKTGKKAKPSAKRKVSLSSDDEQISVVNSLPPAVDGQLRCFLRVSVSKVTWTVRHPPDDVGIRVKWWGEQGDSALLRPVKKKAGVVKTDWTSVRYPICSGPKQFSAYLKDMGTLVLDMVHGPAKLLLGQASVPNIADLSASYPIKGFFPVMSVSQPSSKVAEIYVSVKFESVSAAYNRLSSSIPTTDTGLEKDLLGTAPHPTPPPYTNPATPVTHPRHQLAVDDDLFTSPAAAKGVKFSSDPPERLEYTIEPSMLSLLDEDIEHKQLSPGDHRNAPAGKSQTMTELPEGERKSITTSIHTTTNQEDHHTFQGGSSSHYPGMDWIGTLLEKGQKLREGMVKTALLDDGDDDNNDDFGAHQRLVPDERASYASGSHILPGQLFKEILSKPKTKQHAVCLDDTLDQTDDHTLGTDDKAFNLLMGSQHPVYIDSSLSDVSDHSGDISDFEHPIYDESLLKDLFYTAEGGKGQSDSDSGQTVSSEEYTILSDDESNLTLEDPGNMRQRRRKYSPVHTKEQTRVDRRQKRHKVSKSASTKPKPAKTLENRTSVHDDRADVSSERTSLSSPSNSPSTATGSLATASDSTVTTSYTTSSDPISTGGNSTSPSDLADRVGADTLTALGRANTARIMIDSLQLHHQDTDEDRGKMKPSTFLVEYSFPAVSSKKEHGKEVFLASEITRIASKKIENSAVSFAHRSVFPVFFNASIVDRWLSLALTFRVFRRDSGQRQPAEIGFGVLPLKTVLQSRNLSHTSDVLIKGDFIDQEKNRLFSEPVATLKVKVELGVDGKELSILPTNVSIRTPSIQSVSAISKPVVLTESSSHNPQVVTKPPLPRGPSPHVRELHQVDPITSEMFTLHSLLWIPEGKDILQDLHDSPLSRPSPYLVCRMFWCDDVTKSAVTWTTSNPRFGFKQVAPVLLTPTLLQRACNNFIVVEVWNKRVPQTDQLIGIIKVSVHQLYLSFRDPKITKTLLKSKFPVVCVDEWCDITNPFTGASHGKLKVLLAVGADEQISSLLVIRGVVEKPSPQEKPLHHLDNKSDQNDAKKTSHDSSLVEHQFEVVVEDIRGLSVFRSTVWGETDCFVQYHFPHQTPTNDALEEVTPSLKAHRSTTTLCVPDPSFQDVARHTFLLPGGLPVQKYLLAAFSGSWTGVGSLPGMSGIPFELWRRYYYPNIRDQLVAKGCLPVAKLCAMVTMQKQREPSVQAFSLPLVVIPGDEDGSRQAMVQDTGLLNITVKYRHSTLSTKGLTARPDQVCLNFDVIRACGLKAAASYQARTNSSMAYPADVGINGYVVVRLPFPRKSRFTTRTVARSFAPEFNHHVEVPIPLSESRKDGGDQAEMSLAEKLEMSEATLEVWHQMSRGGSEMDNGPGDQGMRTRDDVLLGYVTIPLVDLLFHKTGIRGWHALFPPKHLEPGTDLHGNDHVTTKPIGGIQLSIKFSESNILETVVDVARSMGWCPPPGVEATEDGLWENGDEDPSAHGGVELRIRTSRAWVSESIADDFRSHAGRNEVLGYVRFKFYDKSPICSRLVPLKKTKSCFSLEVKHRKSFPLPASSSLAWYLSEEVLEMQVWLGGRGTSASLPGRRDSLVGSAFVELSSLVTPHRQRAEISRDFCLFKSGSADLSNCGVHVQVSLTKPGDKASQQQEEQTQDMDESASTGYPSTEQGHGNGEESSSRSSMDRWGTPQKIPSTPPRTNSEDKDTFAAHVIVQEARHLPLVPAASGERIPPNVYVSYQATADSCPVCTPVVVTATSPLWEYQKLERIKLSTLKSQSLIFKVWHRADISRPGPPSAEGAQGDRALGFVSMDLAPLAAGLRELIGWYNVMSFAGECKGQMKVGVIPLTPVSPSRCLSTKSRLVFSPPQTSSTQAPSSSFLINNSVPTSRTPEEERSRMVDIFSSQIAEQAENLKRLQTHRSTSTNQIEPYIARTNQNSSDMTGARHDAAQGEIRDSTIGTLSSCSTSFLFSQLRRNMTELENLKRGLEQKLRPDTSQDEVRTGIGLSTDQDSYSDINGAQGSRAKAQDDNTREGFSEHSTGMLLGNIEGRGEAQDDNTREGFSEHSTGMLLGNIEGRGEAQDDNTREGFSEHSTGMLLGNIEGRGEAQDDNTREGFPEHSTGMLLGNIEGRGEAQDDNTTEGFSEHSTETRLGNVESSGEARYDNAREGFSEHPQTRLGNTKGRIPLDQEPSNTAKSSDIEETDSTVYYEQGGGSERLKHFNSFERSSNTSDGSDNDGTHVGVSERLESECIPHRFTLDPHQQDNVLNKADHYNNHYPSDGGTSYRDGGRASSPCQFDDTVVKITPDPGLECASDLNFQEGKDKTVPDDHNIDTDDSESEFGRDVSLGVSGYQGVNTAGRFLDMDSWLSDDETGPINKLPISAVLIDDSEIQEKDGHESKEPRKTKESNDAFDSVKNAMELFDNHSFCRIARKESFSHNNGSTDNDKNDKIDTDSGEDDLTDKDSNLDVINIGSHSDPQEANTATCACGHDNNDVMDDTNSHSNHDEDVTNIVTNTKPSAAGDIASLLPNFFMPTRQLEQSMRALRLDAKLGRPYSVSGKGSPPPRSKLLARAANALEGGEGIEGVSREFARRKVRYKAKKDECPPLSSFDADRIARIFSSKEM
ncbi:C2 domain-containing protein 3 isoform X3 [Nematostella vectensis]|uniref:C2 domain-containing protein 3 isoform X3 n=1 Tax=Nematostella vectensis TaxID=45351 RepID=UPI002077793A|nr:C2 domain-containing protein 3 isoform X3 [Nematostella vectensis]